MFDTSTGSSAQQARVLLEGRSVSSMDCLVEGKRTRLCPDDVARSVLLTASAQAQRRSSRPLNLPVPARELQLWRQFHKLRQPCPAALAVVMQARSPSSLHNSPVISPACVVLDWACDWLSCLLWKGNVCPARSPIPVMILVSLNSGQSGACACAPAECTAV